LGQYDEALRHYESAIKKDNSNGEFFFNRAQVKAKLDKLDECILDFQTALKNLTEPK
jgi:tetratricopeptide (TPR) repeat protein